MEQTVLTQRTIFSILYLALCSPYLLYSCLICWYYIWYIRNTIHIWRACKTKNLFHGISVHDNNKPKPISCKRTQTVQLTALTTWSASSDLCNLYPFSCDLFRNSCVLFSKILDVTVLLRITASNFWVNLFAYNFVQFASAHLGVDYTLKFGAVTFCFVHQITGQVIHGPVL